MNVGIKIDETQTGSKEFSTLHNIQLCVNKVIRNFFKIGTYISAKIGNFSLHAAIFRYRGLVLRR